MQPLLDSRQLRAFCVLAHEGNFTKTGQILHLTQSAISHAISSLEDDLGCQLFYRSGKKIILTQQGKMLLNDAEAIQRLMSQARARVGSLDMIMRGNLRIGCSAASSQFIIPTVLREFKESFPAFTITIHPGNTPTLLNLLENNQIDLAICLSPAGFPQISYRRIFQDELEFLVSPLHSWAQSKKLLPKDIQSQNYILYNRNSHSFALIENYFWQRNIKLRSFIELDSIEAIKELVKEGLGVGIMAKWMARPELEAGSLVNVPLGKKCLKRQWSVAYIKDKPLNLAEETFIGLCEQVGTSLIRPK
jgi:DNA-binding transcriptional LysR family regulator